MDDDIRDELLVISKQVQGVGRMIGSTKISLVKLTTLSECLEIHRDILETYIRIQTDRYQ